MAVYLAVAGDVFDGVLFCAILFPRDSWMCSWTELRQFLRIFRLILAVSPHACFILFFKFYVS